MSDQLRHQRASELFLRATALPEDEREAFLAAQCADDQDLLREVQSLLASDSPGHDPLDHPALGEAFRLTPSMIGRQTIAPRDTLAIPEQVGDYQIIERIGAGGMGAVYRARQQHPARDVAIKVVRPGISAIRSARRLAHEAQILGHLQHDGIARVFDAGVFDTGAGAQPFFVMELIDGEPLLDYARHHDASTHERLTLFTKLCDAVRHAHQNGIIHRDLKPANVLVTADGQPKTLDFGVARVTDSDLQVSTLQTDIGQLIGTVSYMSPEQVAGDSASIDARSDVYALGVILYELLAERLPHDLAEATLPEAARIIRDEEPQSLATISGEFRGDVDTIVTKALEKEPDRRYQSAAAIADDVRRYLRDEPITARPPSTIYQFRKFVRRNRPLVGGITGIFVVLIAGIAGTSMGLARAVNARNIAEENEQRAVAELAKSEQVTSFLRQILEGSSPWIAAGRDTELLRAILADAAGGIDTALADQPEAEIVIRNTIGETYRYLGDFEKAEKHLQRAHALAERHLEPDDPSFLDTRYNLGLVYVDAHNVDKALSLFQENLKHLPSFEDDPRVDTLYNLYGILEVYEGRSRPDRIVDETEDLLPAAVKRFGRDNDAVQLLQVTRADALRNLEEFEEAENLYGVLLDQRRKQYGRDHPFTMRALWGLATTYRRRGMLDEAEPLYRAYLESCLEVFGGEHQQTAAAKNSLALVLKDRGRYDEAVRMFSEVLEFNRRDLGDAHRYTDTTMVNLANAYHAAGQYAEAERLMRQRVAIHRDHFGSTDQRTLLAQVNLAVQQQQSGQLKNAFALYEDAIATARTTDGIGGNYLGYFLLLYGKALTEQQRYAKAEPALLEAWDILIEALPIEHFQCQNTAVALIDLYERWRHADEAEQWRSTASDIGAVVHNDTSGR